MIMEINTLPQCIVVKSFDINQIQHMRRSMVDNRYLIMSFVHMNENGRNQIQYLNLIFSSVFKMF